MSKVDIKNYTVDMIDLFGVQNEFKLCHLPFLVSDDIFGALALEGSSGTGKTTIVNRLGQLNEGAGGGCVRFYSADKMRYEDFTGCPIPNMEKKVMDIFPMPNAIATCETVLIDEINRASYENQEKFLQLFASRKIDSLPIKCKYLYAAMNPVMTDGKEVYEGVQPLDKALGERMFALVRMTPFNKLDERSRLQIMQECFNQVKWKPSDQAIELFSEYIKRAKTKYEENKIELKEQTASYVDAIQNDLHKEKSGIVIEARRAQFILINILALHALNSVNSTASFETSALAALQISFPNPLWEQKINLEALRIAHQKNQNILKLDTAVYRKKASSRNRLTRAVEELQDLVKQKASKEVISKAVNGLLPDPKDDRINFYTYCSAIVDGLTPIKKGVKQVQNVLKEQEFSRILKNKNDITESKSFLDLEKLHTEWTTTKKVPPGYEIPTYFLESSTETDPMEMYMEVLTIPGARIVSAIYKECGADPATLEELIEAAQSLVDATQSLREVAEYVNSITK